MKMKNVLAGLLLVAVAQVAYAVENTIQNYGDKPIKVTIVYKNNKQEIRMLESYNPNTKKGNQAFILTTKANPIKEIYFSYMGTKGLWVVPISYNSKVEGQRITIYNATVDGQTMAYIQSWYFPGDGNVYMELENGYLSAREIHEEV